jgi:hypothetical protein
MNGMKALQYGISAVFLPTVHVSVVSSRSASSIVRGLRQRYRCRASVQLLYITLSVLLLFDVHENCLETVLYVFGP